MIRTVLARYVGAVGLCVCVCAHAAEVRETYTYDALGRLTEVKPSHQTPTRYTYDPAGNRLGVNASSAPAPTPAPSPSPTPCIPNTLIDLGLPPCNGTQGCMESFGRACGAAGGKAVPDAGGLYQCRRVCP